MKTLLALIFAALSFGQVVPAVNSPITSWPLGGIRITEKFTIANSGSNLTITRLRDGAVNTVAKAAAVTQSLTLLTPGVNFKVTDCAFQTSTAFAGTTTLAGTLGVTGNLTGCLSVAYNLKTAVPNSAIPSVIVSAASFNGTDAVIVALTSTIDNISAINAGVLVVWFEIVYYP